MMRGFAAVLLIAFLTSIGGAWAQGRAPIEIVNPRDRTLKVAVQRFAQTSRGAERVSQELAAGLRAGLDFSGMFTEIREQAFLGPVASPRLDDRRPVSCDRWRQIGADALVQGEVQASADAVRVRFRVLDVARGCKSLKRNQFDAKPNQAGRIGKAVADDVVAAFTGRPGVSDTEITFASNRGGTKEIHVMDADGHKLRAATRNRSINSFPDWSPDGSSIAYTSYRHRNRPALFLLTRGRRSPGRILRNMKATGPIYRGTFSPDGNRLALVMSHRGATDIFTVGKGGAGLRNLTRHRAIDISPAWAPDGRRMAFVSDRTGSPQVYVMGSDGSGARRITYNGSYNTAPAWSPDGQWIAYESRIGGQFDIWLIDPEGQSNVPLISHGRSDEHPSWAPDGRKLAFSSTRRGRADIYVVDVNGDNLRRITNGGENTNPDWGPYRR
ncbi:MAG: Tol-Pal system beta propeller repeat protein TolB [bacterium]|nr:Tol-Pal system beta propeller repeat protein TolB [bacterium]